jgi:hypothetical protein
MTEKTMEWGAPTGSWGEGGGGDSWSKVGGEWRAKGDGSWNADPWGGNGDDPWMGNDKADKETSDAARQLNNKKKASEPNKRLSLLVVPSIRLKTPA